MIEISKIIDKAISDGYDISMAKSKACQDIFLKLLSETKLRNNITIKGGVVIRSLSKNFRRATSDIDFDLIHYPITDNAIKNLIKELNNNKNGILIKIEGKLENLKHQIYEGKRVFIDISDKFNRHIKTKLDIGIHKYISLEQTEYCFDFDSNNKTISLLINTKEQMFTEKLYSLIRLGARTKRYKDLYDMYYLQSYLDKNKLFKCFKVVIFDKSKNCKNLNDIIKNINIIFKSRYFTKSLKSSNRNWLSIDNDKMLSEIKNYLISLNQN